MPEVSDLLPSLPAPWLNVSVGEQDLTGGWCVVSVAGEVDLATAPLLESALSDVLQQRPGARFALDLSEVGHLDSSGLAVLIGFQKRLAGNGSLKLVAPPDHIHNVLRLMGLDGLFDIWAVAADS